MTIEVIGAGYGRTGTDSLRTALEQLGFTRCYHMREVLDHPEHADAWRDALEGRPVDWDTLLAGYRATTDFPAGLCYRELADHHPDAKVVLTVRDPERWYHSARSTIFNPVMVTVVRAAALVNPRLRRLAAMGRPLFGRVLGGWWPHKATAIARFEQHVREVRETIPPQRLLVYEVSQGWEPLCAFLGVPMPDQPFPHGNTREDFRRDRWKILLRRPATRG